MSRTLTLSGWGQPCDALLSLLPGSEAVEYARHASPQAALLEILERARYVDRIVAWSLGAQLALRAVASGRLRLKQLVLIAPPFQFVKTEALPLGMPADLFAMFCDNYRRNPERTLRKAWELIAFGDIQTERIRMVLAGQDRQAVLARDWLAWLHCLEIFSCTGLNLSDPPPTLLIHGDQDAVVYPKQMAQFSSILPNAATLMLEQCGHAPHWHDPDRVRQAIYEHANG